MSGREDKVYLSHHIVRPVMLAAFALLAGCATQVPPTVNVALAAYEAELGFAAGDAVAIAWLADAALQAPGLLAGPANLAAGAGDVELAVFAMASPTAAEDREPRGTVIFVHGYMARAESSLPAIRALAEGGWLVLAPDLPGHGRSGGDHLDIDSFDDYGRALSRVVGAASAAGLPRPLALVGHSLGGAVILSYLEEGGCRADAALLLAPLLRIRAHAPASIGAAVAGLFSDELPGGARRGWFRAYRAWASRPHARLLVQALSAPDAPRLGFLLMGRDEALSNAASARLGRSLAGLAAWGGLSTLSGLGHWELDKADADPQLWAALLDSLGELTER